ncbi:hypothetical protein D3C73_1252350 [compost metagenome]
MHHGRKAHEHRRFLTWAEDFGDAQVADVGAGGELTVHPGTTGVHHPLWNAFAVEALQLLQQVGVLQQHRAVGAGRLRILVVTNRCTAVAGQGRGLDGHRQQAGGQACCNQQAAGLEML